MLSYGWNQTQSFKQTSIFNCFEKKLWSILGSNHNCLSIVTSVLLSRWSSMPHDLALCIGNSIATDWLFDDWDLGFDFWLFAFGDFLLWWFLTFGDFLLLVTFNFWWLLTLGDFWLLTCGDFWLLMTLYFGWLFILGEFWLWVTFDFGWLLTLGDF